VTTQPAVRRQARSSVRRRQVLDAALSCFAEKGIAGTAIEDICSRSGASVGSLYHLFGSKTGVAAALYLDALADFQGAVRRRLKPTTDARAGVCAVIVAQIAWVGKNPARARFLQEMRHTETVAAHAEEIRLLNREFGLAIGAWAQSHIGSRKLRRMPIDVFMAQLLGPTHEYLRGRLAGRQCAPRNLAVQLLGESAWRALGIERIEVDSTHKRGGR
jgi:AcrR family transcriptional regulator